MRRYSGARLLSATTAALLLILTSCTDPNDAGKDVLPHDETITGHYVDSFSIYLSTLQIDSATTYKRSQCMLGNYYDDQFGHIFAETYVSPRLSGSNVTFGADRTKLTLDSITLTLDLSGFYGRYNEPLPLKIHEITEAFATDSSLYSRSSLDVDSSYDLARGYNIDFSDLPGYLDFITFRLDDSLGRKLLYADPSKLTSNAVFMEYFRGLRIKTDMVSLQNSREPGGVFYIDPRSEKSYMKLHYHDTTAAKAYTFGITNSSERFTRIERTNSAGKLLEQAIQSNGDPLAMNACLEAGALVNMYVSIPGIQSLNPSIINKATLVLKVDDAYLGSDSRYSPPSEIFLFVADSTHTKPKSIAINNSSATYSKATGEYRIPMTQTLMQIFSGKLDDTGFILIPGENGVSLNRVVIGGPGHPTLSPRLEVIYTSLPGQ